MTAPILVTGGTGNLGRRVLALLSSAGRDVRVLSRHRHENRAGTAYVVGDTTAGTGLEPAFAEVDVVIHLAGGARGDDRAAAHIADAARRANIRHIVLVSVIGADRMPIGYFRAKAAAERTIQGSGVSHSILRAAQFHEFIFSTVGGMARLPITLRPGGLRFEPVDADEVARRLVDLALAEPRGRVPDLAGPEVLDIPALLRPLRPAGRRVPTIPVRIPGPIGRAYRSGDNLAGTSADRGVRTWERWVAARSMST